MPIPQPHADEAESEFVARCAGDKVMNTDFPDRKQRVAVCYQTWRDRHKTQAKSAAVSAVGELRAALAAGSKRLWP